MAVALLHPSSQIQDISPAVTDYLRFFGTVCSVQSVARVGTVVEGAVLHLWVDLSDDDERGQNVIYDALRRYQASEHAHAVTVDLHIVFADEDETAFPSNVELDFVRE